MHALTLNYESRSLHERDVPEPVLRRDDEVLLKVTEVGVCGTDRDLAQFLFGHPPAGSPYLVLGHEAVAEVVRTGAAASHLAPGQLVIPTVRRGCDPPCPQCSRGRRDLCVTNRCTERGIFGEHGYFAELAVDRACDLVPLDRRLLGIAVLVEPLSVVEKAVAMALRLRLEPPRTALVIGAGTIGVLAALLLRQHGCEVTVCSREATGSGRAELVALAGAQYVNAPEGCFDVVIEAAGSPEAAATGLQALGPLGVLIVLGAMELPERLSLIGLITGNQVMAGSVNASPDDFARAAQDLERLPREVLEGMVERCEFGAWRRSIGGSGSTAPKMVHVIG